MSKVKANRDYYTITPNMVLYMKLSPHAKLLYVIIKSIAGEDGLCWSSQNTLAKYCGVSTKTIIRAKKELVKAGLIEIQLQKIGKYYGHVIKVIDIWELNNDNFKNKKGGCEVKQTPRSKKDTDSEVKEPPDAVENNHSNNIQLNNNPNEFVIEIPGQVNNIEVNNNNNEHERTPGAAAVMQIDRARPGAGTKTLPRPSQHPSVPVDIGIALPKDETQPNTIDRREEILGMSVEKAVEIWRLNGAPVVHLGPGENAGINFPNLDILLANPDVLDRHLEEIKVRLAKVRQQS